MPSWWRLGDPPLEPEDKTRFRERVGQLVEKLDADERETVEELIRGAARSAILGACHLLDGYSGGGDGSFVSPLPDTEIAEFALYLKVYVDGRAWEKDEAVASVRITDKGLGDHLLGWLIHATDTSAAQE